MTSPDNTIVQEGVILSAERAKETAERFPMLGMGPPYWMPTPQEVSRVTSAMIQYVSNLRSADAKVVMKNQGDYRYQYVGFSQGSGKVLLISGSCSKYRKASSTWDTQFAFVLDGGSCFFRIKYDFNKSEFRDFEVNHES